MLDRRVHCALTLYVFAVAGLFLVVAPWTPLCEQAAQALAGEPLDRWLLSGWVRGAISGLGASDLAVAAQMGAELWRDRGGAR